MLFRLALLIITTLITFNSYALGKLGHQLVCDIAYQQASPSTKEYIDGLLTSLPADEKVMVNEYNFADKQSPMTFGKACTWADAIKKGGEYKSMNPWHYVNVERDVDQIHAHSCQKDCITQAIPFHSKQLTKGKTSRERLEALMFLGHWVGDIHQPMHVSFADDWGGNKTKVNAQGEKCDNIHWLWDQCLLSRQTPESKLAEQYADLLPILSAFSQKQIADWQQANVIEWANESLMLARNQQVKYCELNGDTCASNSQQPIKFAEVELDALSLILNTRVKQASVRLAHHLDNLVANR